LLLGGKDVHAHNSFDSPRAVEPSMLAVKAEGGLIEHSCPPASITKFEVTLG